MKREGFGPLISRPGPIGKVEGQKVPPEVPRDPERIAATTDLGMSSRCYEVLRLVPGSAERVLVEALAS